jgi:TolA-binding protein
MIPVSFLTSMLAGLAAKVGINQLTKHGYMPQSTYLKAALKALEKDDLDEAIRSYHLAVKNWPPSQRTEIAAEIISMAIAVRVAKLQRRVDELERQINPRRFSLQFWHNLLPKNKQRLEELRQEQQGCQEAISVLHRMKEKLHEKD